MKLKFETFFRGFILVLVLILFWGFWADAQETKVTNVAAKIETPAKTTEAIISIPAVLKQNEALLTFDLDRVSFLQPQLWRNPRWQYLASLIYIILAFYVSKFF